MNNKDQFVHFLVESGALKFGDFVTKSGRNTPYFINTGEFRTGASLSKLAEFYAAAFMQHFDGKAQNLYGPAYKGIPLCAATAMKLSDVYAKNLSFTYNRKEVKDHGDVGILLGSKLKDGDRVVIIEDVTTSGKSIEETFPILKEQGDIRILGLMVSLNRMERGKGTKCALTEIRDLYGIETAAIVTMKDVVDELYNKEIDGRVVIDDAMLNNIKTYFAEYGAEGMSL